MDSPNFDRLLNEAAREPDPALPPGFSLTVLHRARQWREFSRANRRLLTAASITAIALAFVVAQWARIDSGADTLPPRLTLFHADDFSPPTDAE